MKTKPEQPEIKVSDKPEWQSVASFGVRKNYARIIFIEGDFLVYYWYNEEGHFGHCCRVGIDGFIKSWEPIPQKKTRPITWDDVRKLLAEHGVIYFKCLDDEVWRLDNTPGLWYRPPATFEKMQFSHNPFADNPVIIGPNVVDGEGL